MKLNILLITYNQEKYIGQALESISMQKTSFEFNVIVADDCSTDCTLDLISKYAENSNIEFKFLPNTVNLGYNKNYERSIKSCDGEYIAVLEGDDYWTDPERLEKHVQFLDNHKESSMTFNRIIFYYQDQNDYKINEWTVNDDFRYFTSKQQLTGNKIGNLSACVFRRYIFDKLKPGLFDIKIADWMLGIIFGQYGFITELKDTMSVYRIHGKGQWSRQNEEEQIKGLINSIPIYNEYLDFKFNDDFIRYKNYLERSLIEKKKYGFRDFIPPVLIRIFEWILPPVITRKLKK